MWRAISFFATATLLYTSCAPPAVITIYKGSDNQTSNIHSVLVAGVIEIEDTVVRSNLENYFVAELNKTGYNAVSSISAFGAKGLTSLGQEQTMKKLCDYGLDAVLTIALVDASKEKYSNQPASSTYAASYYLDRIWNYEKIQANLRDPQQQSPHFWECILFDLYSLRPLGAIRTQLYDVDKTGTINPQLAKAMIGKLTREKILRKRNGYKKPVANIPASVRSVVGPVWR